MTKDKPHTFVLYAHAEDIEDVQDLSEVLDELGVHILAVTNYDFFLEKMEKHIPKA